jgi:hypothetical protein
MMNVEPARLATLVNGTVRPKQIREDEPISDTVK